jgi:hypothetical protein
MRDRPSLPRITDAQTARPATPISRRFTPTELNQDDLAEAIRSLLEPVSTPQIGGPSRPHSDLLSLPRGVSHVVEANEAP